MKNKTNIVKLSDINGQLSIYSEFYECYIPIGFDYHNGNNDHFQTKLYNKPSYPIIKMTII